MGRDKWKEDWFYVFDGMGGIYYNPAMGCCWDGFLGRDKGEYF
jgi:hypothetical protein